MHRKLSQRPGASRQAGMTLVEMLIALGILGVIIAFASSGIVQALMVNRLQQDATNTQSKLRRVTEIVTQDLRSAVLGTLVDFPADAGHRSVSFLLLSGDGGIAVEPSPGSEWGSKSHTYVYSSNPDAVDALVGGPAILVNGRGEGVFIPTVTSVGGSWSGSGSAPRINHSGCTIPVNYTPNTRIYGVYALGFEYKPDERTLYQHTFDTQGLIEEPMAYNLSEFALQYEYTSASGTLIEDAPRRVDGAPQPVIEDGGTEYELTRLHLTMRSDSGDVERDYTGFIELAGLGNEERPITSVVDCTGGTSTPPGEDEPGGGDPGGDEDEGDEGDDEPGGGDPGDDEDEGDDDQGGGGSGPGDDEDDGGGGDEPNCFRFLWWWICR